MMQASARSVEVRKGCGPMPNTASSALISPSGRKATAQITAETLCGMATGSRISVRQKPVVGKLVVHEQRQRQRGGDLQRIDDHRIDERHPERVPEHRVAEDIGVVLEAVAARAGREQRLVEGDQRRPQPEHDHGDDGRREEGSAAADQLSAAGHPVALGSRATGCGRASSSAGPAPAAAST